jgi:hypothetical protein
MTTGTEGAVRPIRLDERAARRLRYELASVRDRLAWLRSRVRANGAPHGYATLWAELAAPPGDPAMLAWNGGPDGALVEDAGGARLAAECRSHRLRLLSAEPVDVSDPVPDTGARHDRLMRLLPAEWRREYRPIQWHCDFTSGHVWSATAFFRDVAIPPAPGVDIKVPWELSRFGHVGALARGDLEAGGREFLLQTLDWIAANPYLSGINWRSAMDVAVRSINWIWGLRLFEPVVRTQPAALGAIVHSIHEHARFVATHLDYFAEGTNDHYLADVAALIHVGAAFPEFPESDGWLLFGLQELVMESGRQVHDDGSSVMASTSYHRLVTEIFAAGAAVAERIPEARRRRLAGAAPSLLGRIERLRAPEESGINLAPDGRLLPAVFRERLRRMARYTTVLMKPNGLVPQIGDNDSSRLHRLLPAADMDVRDHAHIPALVGLLLDDRALLDAGAARQAEARLIAGDTAPGGVDVDTTDAGDTAKADAAPVHLPDAGIVVARNDAAWLAVTCGTNGMFGRGGHGHNEKLGFELNVRGADIIVDGGCPAYTGDPDLRNRFRSTWAHSTVAVVGLEQDPLPQGARGLFRLPERCARALVVDADGSIAGYHDGYGPPHRRRFRLTADALVIEDALDLVGERWLVFNLDPAVRVEALRAHEGSVHCVLAHADGVSVSVRVEPGATPRIADGCFGLGYGIPTATRSLQVGMSAPHARTELRWSE